MVGLTTTTRYSPVLWLMKCLGCCFAWFWNRCDVIQFPHMWYDVGVFCCVRRFRCLMLILLGPVESLLLLCLTASWNVWELYALQMCLFTILGMFYCRSIQMFKCWCIMIHHDTSWCIMMYHDVSWYIMMYHDTSWCIMKVTSRVYFWKFVIRFIFGACSS